MALIVDSLHFPADSDTATIGDLRGLSSNALVMVKMSIFSAWAELQIASSEQKYLVEVLNPHIAKLTPLWLASLREYARLRFEPDVSTTGSGPAVSGNLDSIYAALNRETLLQVRSVLNFGKHLLILCPVLPIFMASSGGCYC